MTKKPVLHQAFEYEQYELVQKILSDIKSLNLLIEEDSDGATAWQCDHVPVKHLKKVIETWLDLTHKGKPKIELKKAVTVLSYEECFNICHALSQGRLNSIEDYNGLLMLPYSESRGTEILNHINFNIDAFGLLLVALDNQFNLLSESAMDLTGILGLFMAILMALSGFLTLYRIYYRNNHFRVEHYIEIIFISISIILGMTSFASSSPLLMILGIIMSIAQSVIEFIYDISKFEKAPKNTDRKVAYLQHCLDLGLHMIDYVRKLL